MTPLYPDVSPQEQRAARAMAIVGAALMEASNAMLGKPSKLPANLLGTGAEGCLVTVNELIHEFMFAKARAGRGDRYLRQLRVVMKSFNAGRGRLPLDQINAAAIEKWTANTEWSNRTVRGYLSDIRTMFNFAVKRGYLDRNPAAGVELPVLDTDSEVHVHTPAEVRTVLDHCRHAHLDVCRRMAIRYFAGVRSAEANRLTEEDLKLDQGWLQVPAAKSKTRARRLVTIQPNLRAWLELGGELRPLGHMTVQDVLRGSKVAWYHNVTRHSFVSYHLAQFGNAGKTALEAGHTEQMLFAHYRALVTPAAAEEFWAIRPK